MLDIYTPGPPHKQVNFTRGCTDPSPACKSSILHVYRTVTVTPHKQVRFTRACTDHSTVYNVLMLHVYRSVTACGQPNCRGARLPLPPTFGSPGWSAIARQIKRCYNISSTHSPQVFQIVPILFSVLPLITEFLYFLS